MADEKKYSAKEAAIAVLKKAEEVFKASELAKAARGDKAFKSGYGAKDLGQSGVHGQAGHGSIGQSNAGVRVRTGNSYGKDMASSKAVAHGDAKAIHKEKLAELKAMPKPDLGKAEGEVPAQAAPAEAPLKGHLKLAKFIGHMESKRKAKAAPAPEQKGVHNHNHEGPGNSPAGSFSSAAVKGNTSLPKQALNDAAKDEHKKVIAEQKAMPKPNLPG